MALDRQQIERRDFTIVRRGYEPDEVERHLREIAEQVERLSQAQSQRSSSLSATAAERVRGILDAAEQSAEDIRRSAEEEARGVLDDAQRQAQEAQQRADADARTHVDRVQEQAAVISQGADRLQSELDSLLERLRDAAGTVIDSIRTEGSSLQGDLDQLRSQLAESRASEPAGGGVAVAEPAPAEPEPVYEAEITEQPAYGADETASAVDEPAVSVQPSVGAEPTGTEQAALEEAALEEATLDEAAADDVALEEPAPAEEPQPEPEPEPEPVSSRQSGSGSEGARLIALNMALNGTPREETADYLRTTFNLDDEAMLDDVYARVSGS